MKKNIKSLWVRALRSGKYKKAKGQLKTDSGFCCLGVLTDLYINKTKYKKGWDGKFSGEDGELPVVVRRWAGLKEANPQVLFGGKIQGNYGDANNTRQLSVINDHSEANFKTIAALISKSL